MFETTYFKQYASRIREYAQFTAQYGILEATPMAHLARKSIVDHHTVVTCTHTMPSLIIWSIHFCYC